MCAVFGKRLREDVNTHTNKCLHNNNNKNNKTILMKDI